MDRMTDEIREEAPWTMMFADDIVICSESKEHVEENTESWIHSDTDENTGGGDGGGRVEVVAIVIRSDKNGLTCDLPVRPSFRLSDGHDGQEVVSNL